jgi:hypothetical protein
VLHGELEPIQLISFLTTSDESTGANSIN